MKSVYLRSLFATSLGLLMLSSPASSAETYQAFYDGFAKSLREIKSVPPTGGNLHAVLIIDTKAANAESIGVHIDARNFLSLLRDIFPDGQAGKHKLATLKVLTGDDVAEKTVIETLLAIDSNQNDTLLVYYSGHGGADTAAYNRVLQIQALRLKLAPDFDSPMFFATSAGNIMRTAVKDAMTKRPAQLRILISDACSNFPNLREASRALSRSAKAPEFKTKDEIRRSVDDTPVQISGNEVLAEALFFDSVGWVSIGAPLSQTTPGSSKGGIFTNGLFGQIKELNEVLKADGNSRLNPHLDWKWIGGVPLKLLTEAERLPNPGGVRNGAHDPRYIYSQVYADSFPISQLHHYIRK